MRFCGGGVGHVEKTTVPLDESIEPPIFPGVNDVNFNQPPQPPQNPPAPEQLPTPCEAQIDRQLALEDPPLQPLHSDDRMDVDESGEGDECGNDDQNGGEDDDEDEDGEDDDDGEDDGDGTDDDSDDQEGEGSDDEEEDQAEMDDEEDPLRVAGAAEPWCEDDGEDNT